MQGWGKVKEAALYAGISPRTMRDWLKQGLDHSRMPSGTILINRDAIDKFISRYTVSENEVDRIVNELTRGLS